MSAEEPLTLGGPERPLSHRVRIANALYDHAKWMPNEINYWLDQLLAEHAHELAEKVRAHDGVEPDDYRQPQAWREGYSDGVQDSADLIDPLKES